MLNIPTRAKALLIALLFGLCVAPTLISYRPYVFVWDDSDYLQRSISVSQALWAGNIHGVSRVLASSIRPPIMALLGLPWGPLTSWDAAGKCFITLAALTSLFAAWSLYLLLRMGVKPVFLAIASFCVVASVGLPEAVAPSSSPGSVFSTHVAATAFLADGLFAWITLAAILLIPYETRTHSRSIKDAVVRGVLWGSVLSLGALTKVSFFYFIALIVPTLLIIRLRNSGLRSAFAAVVSLGLWSAPAAIYWLRWGQLALDNAKKSSFGSTADFFYQPLSPFLYHTMRESPGLVPSFVLAAIALGYLMVKTRIRAQWPDYLALLMTICFGIITLASPNREIRFTLPTILATPFLIAILMSGKGEALSGRSAVTAAILALCGLVAVAVPMRDRADRHSLDRCDAVLTQAVKSNARHILLATDSPTLNIDLMKLAVAVSGSHAPVEVSTLAYRAVSGVPVEEDFRLIREADEVVFQDNNALKPAFTNQRAPIYEQYICQQSHSVPIRVGGNVSVYSTRSGWR